MLANADDLKLISAGMREPIAGTVYIVEFSERDEFWDWCCDREVRVEYQGTLYDRCVYKVVKDPHPEFTLLRWA